MLTKGSRHGHHRLAALLRAQGCEACNTILLIFTPEVITTAQKGAGDDRVFKDHAGRPTAANKSRRKPRGGDLDLYTFLPSSKVEGGKWKWKEWWFLQQGRVTGLFPEGDSVWGTHSSQSDSRGGGGGHGCQERWLWADSGRPRGH